MSAWAHTPSSSAECHLPQTFRGGPNAAVARLAPPGHGHGRRRLRLLCRCCPVRCRCLFVPVFHRVPRVSARARPARSRGGRRGARATQRAGAQASPTHPRRGGGGACDLLGGGFTHHRTRSPVVVASVVAAPPSPNHEPTQRRAGPNGGIGRGGWRGQRGCTEDCQSAEETCSSVRGSTQRTSKAQALPLQNKQRAERTGGRGSGEPRSGRRKRAGTAGAALTFPPKKKVPLRREAGWGHHCLRRPSVEAPPRQRGRRWSRTRRATAEAPPGKRQARRRR